MASFSNGGLNVANSTEAFSPSNCVPLSTRSNLWNVCLFFGANILAHAATIHPRTGATKSNSFRRMLLMLVAPITAGTVATYVIITFLLGIKSHGLKCAHFLGGGGGTTGRCSRWGGWNTCTKGLGTSCCWTLEVGRKRTIFPILK